MGSWKGWKNRTIATAIVAFALIGISCYAYWYEAAGYDRVYEYLPDFWQEKQLPYASEETFQVLRKAYGEIAFRGEFQEGDLEFYDDYREKFKGIVLNETPFGDKESGQMLYLEDLYWGSYICDDYDNHAEYYFFDMDGDEKPELTLWNPRYLYVFDYVAETDSYILWLSKPAHYFPAGARKLMYDYDGKNFEYIQLDQDGGCECETCFYFSSLAPDDPYLVMLPRYADRKKDRMLRKSLKKVLKTEGIYARKPDVWFFRVTKEQYDELLEAYLEAYYSAWEGLEEVRYDYRELFEQH